jgi:glucan 1,3-beta-glucosidase
VLDHHLYRCFTKEDGATPAGQHASNLRDPNGGAAKMLGAAAEKAAEAGGGLVIGEWSGALNPGSMKGISGDAETRARAEYVGAQLALYERVCSGWFFWTYKKEQGGDRGWGWRDAVEGGVFPQWVGIRAGRKTEEREWDGRMITARDQALGRCFNAHNYDDADEQ